MREHLHRINQAIEFPNSSALTTKDDRLYRSGDDIHYDGKRLLNTDDSVSNAIDNVVGYSTPTGDASCDSELTNSFVEPLWSSTGISLTLGSAGQWLVFGKMMLLVIPDGSSSAIENVHTKFHYSGSSIVFNGGYTIQTVFLDNTATIETLGGSAVEHVEHVTLVAHVSIAGSRTVIFQAKRTGSVSFDGIFVRKAGTTLHAIKVQAQ
jgi:hypothetical protein